jgi:hypothetical protein
VKLPIAQLAHPRRVRRRGEREKATITKRKKRKKTGAAVRGRKTS